MSIRARSIGEILDGAFRLYRQDIGLYVFTAVLAALPMALFIILLTLGGGDPLETGGLGLAAFPVAMVAAVVVWAALMHQMNERLEGREPALGPSLNRALRLLLRVVWAAILAYIVLVVMMLVGMLVVAVFVGIGGAFLGEMAGLILAGVAGIAVLVTLGFWGFAGMSLFLPGIVVENLTGYASVKRGFALARKGRMRIVSVVALAWVLIFVPLMAVYFVTGTTRMLLDPEAASSGTIGMGQLAVQQLLGMLSSGFTTPFFVACILLLYYDQRVRLEAYDLEAEADALAD